MFLFFLGEHCIDECRRWDEDLGFYWCHTTDPTLFYTSGSAWDSWTFGLHGNPDKRGKWDYCTPSQTEDPDHRSVMNTRCIENRKEFQQRMCHHDRKDKSNGD